MFFNFILFLSKKKKLFIKKKDVSTKFSLQTPTFIFSIYYRKYFFVYLRLFLLLINKFCFFFPKLIRLQALFIDLSTETSFLTRAICLQYKQFYLLNSWLFGLITNKYQILLHASKLRNELFYYRYHLSSVFPQLLFFINLKKKLNTSIEQEIIQLDSPVIYLLNFANAVFLFNKNSFLIFYYTNNLHLYYYLVLFNKLLIFIRY